MSGDDSDWTNEMDPWPDLPDERTDDETRLAEMCDAEFGWDIDEFIALTRRVFPGLRVALAATQAENERLKQELTRVYRLSADWAARAERAESALTAITELVDQQERRRKECAAADDCECSYKDCYEHGKWHNCDCGPLAPIAAILAAASGGTREQPTSNSAAAALDVAADAPTPVAPQLPEGQR